MSEVILSPETVYVSPGASIVLTATHTLSNVNTFVWKRRINKIFTTLDINTPKYSECTCHGSPKLVIHDIQASDEGVYRVEVKQQNITLESNLTNLYVPEDVNAFSKEELNLIRYKELQTIGRDALQLTFDRHVSPNRLANHLLTWDTPLRTSHWKCTPDQLKCLFPNNGAVVSSDLDISLLYKLLRNTTKVKTPAQKWNIEPKLENTGEGDDIERIHLYRNFIAHPKLKTLSDDDFESKWLDLTVAIDRLSRGVLRESICQLRNKKCEQKENITREKHYMKGKTKDPKAEIVSKWQSHDNLFCDKIRFVQKTEEIIRKKKLVIIIGGSGCGKTSTARHCALKLQTDGWRIVPIDDAREIQSTNTKDDCIFMFDDPVGNLGLDEGKLLDLDHCSGDVLKLFNQENNHKLVITCRNIVYNEAKKHHIFDKYEVVDVDSSDYSLNVDEKKELLKAYGIEGLVDSASLEKAILRFPLMCYMLSANKEKCSPGTQSDRKVLDPREYFRHELDKMSETKTTRVMYASLVLLAIAGNNLTDEKLKVRGLLEDVFRKCNLSERPTPKGIREKLEHSENTYVVKTEFGFKFLHDSLFEVVAFHFGRDEDNQHLFLQHVDLGYITNNTCTRSIEHSTDDLKMNIFPKNYKVLCHRLVLELQTIRGVRNLDVNISFITSIFTHKCWNDEEFVNVLFSSFERNYISELFSKSSRVVKVKSTPKKQQKTIQKQDLPLENFKLGPKGIYEVANDGEKLRLLYWIICNGYLTFLKEYFSKPNTYLFWPFKRVNEIQEEPGHFLWLSIYSMEKDMVKFVLSQMNQKCIKGCINKSFCSSHTPLTLACSLNTLEIVKILVEKGADIKKRNEKEELPLLHAVKNGSLEIIHFLSDKCPFMQDGNTPLHLVSEHGYHNTAKILVTDANVNATNDKMETPLHIACQTNNLNVVEVLVASRNCDKFIPNQRGLVPLHIACRKGNLQMVELVYDSRYLDLKDNDGKTPREYAKPHKNVRKFLK